MIEVKRFEANHVQRLIDERGLMELTPLLKAEHLKNLEGSVFAYSLFHNDKILASGGVMELWPGRAEAWAFVGKGVAKHAVSIVKIAREALDTSSVSRIEATVDCNFIQGHKFLIALGFNIECHRMRSYYMDGRDASLYSRVKGE
jgi:RimJ/RimL family protein N-acetyltransferase